MGFEFDSKQNLAVDYRYEFIEIDIAIDRNRTHKIDERMGGSGWRWKWMFMNLFRKESLINHNEFVVGFRPKKRERDRKINFVHVRKPNIVITIMLFAVP